MNFYKHHLGDYDGATMHLSWDEDMAYTRLLRIYYRDEKPIPLEPKQAYRLVRAQSAAQRKAVDEVLTEFFIQQTDGWHNKRADEEIAQAQVQAEVNRRIATNRVRTVNGTKLNGSPQTHEPKSVGSPQTHEPKSVGSPPRLQTPDSTSHKPHTTHHPESEAAAPPRVRGRLKYTEKPAWRPPTEAELLGTDEEVASDANR